MGTRQINSLDDYKTAGAWMRLCKEVVGKAHVECSKVMSTRDSDMFYTIEKKIGILCSRAEDEMFNDHPALLNDYLDVFFGNLSDRPRTDTDQEIIELAKQLVAGLFEGNQK